MAGFSEHDPLFGTNDGSVTPQRRAVSEADRSNKPCHDNLPEWVRARPLTISVPSARTAIKPISPPLNGTLDGGRILPKQLVTVAETAYFFRVSEKTIRRMIARGELPVVRFGRSVRIHKELIEKIVRQDE